MSWQIKISLIIKLMERSVFLSKSKLYVRAIIDNKVSLQLIKNKEWD